MTTPVQAFIQAKKAIEALKQNPQVQLYQALEKRMQDMERGGSSVSPPEAVRLYLDKLALQEKVHAIKIRHNVPDAAFLTNRMLASIMRSHPDLTETEDRVAKGNAVFIRFKKVR